MTSKKNSGQKLILAGILATSSISSANESVEIVEDISIESILEEVGILAIGDSRDATVCH